MASVAAAVSVTPALVTLVTASETSAAAIPATVQIAARLATLAAAAAAAAAVVAAAAAVVVAAAAVAVAAVEAAAVEEAAEAVAVDNRHSNSNSNPPDITGPTRRLPT